MGQFNSKLVESLDWLNKILALVFLSMAAFRFWDMLEANALAAVFETLAVLGAGILTCGYIAIMLNINSILTQLLEQKNGQNHSE